MARTKSITETGPKALRGIRNPDLYPSLSLKLSDIELQSIKDELARSIYANYDAAHGHLGYQSLSDLSLYTPLVVEGLDYGSSLYDQGLMLDATPQDILNQRAESQPWYAQIGAGIAKGVLLAGTTFLDGTLGLLVGGYTAAKEGRWSGLWDNDFSKAMQSVNEWSELAMPNYYTEEEQNSPWYENIFTANFLGDKFIKNLGFTVGAFYSGGLEAGAIKGLGKLAMRGAKALDASISTIKKISKASSMAASGIGAVTSAVNEGRIEALNNSKEWYEAQLAPITDDYKAKRKELEAIGDYSGIAELDKSYEKTLALLNEDRLKMGNADLLMNIPILTASNLIQFGKLYANGFRTGKRANNIVGNIRDGYKGATTRRAGVKKAILDPLSEGTEEITQGMASRISGDYYADDINNFYKARTDPDYQEKTLSWWKSFAQGINETVNDGSAWEEFFIGTLTGALGMPRFRSARNQQGKFQSPITLEGGILGELRENREQIAREQEIVDYMNNRLQSPEFRNYYQGLSRHNYYQAAMDLAIQDDDEFNFKNAEQAQFISDISMFDAAGKIGDLTTLINSAYDTSDENLESIVKNTTSVITAQEQANEINDTIQYYQEMALQAELSGDIGVLNFANGQIQHLNNSLSNLRDTYVGPFVDQDGNPLYSTEEGKQKMIDKFTQTKDEMLGQIDDYVKTKIDLQDRLPQNISNDQLEELIFLQTQVNNWDKRGELIASVIKNILTEVCESLKTSASLSELGDAKLSGQYSDSAEFINNLILGNTPKQLMLILTNPKNSDIAMVVSNIIGAYGNDVISNLDKSNVLNMLDDIVKIGKSKDLYQKRLEEYIANPTAHAKALELAREQQETARRNSQEVTDIDRINNSNVSDIVLSVEDGDIILDDDFDALLAGAESDDARDKVEAARDIIDTERRTRDDLNALASSDEITEEQLNDAIALLAASKQVAESGEELLDLDTEVFNNPRALDDVDVRQTIQQAAELQGLSLEEATQQYNDIMNQRLDNAKNALSIVRSLNIQREDELSDIPSPDNTSRGVFKVGDTISLSKDVNSPSADKFTITADKGDYYEASLPSDSQVYRIKKSDAGNYDIYRGATELTGHDSVDKNVPVNAPSVELTSPSEATRELTDKTLEKYGHSREASPELAKSFDNIFSYVDRGLAKGVSDKDILDAIAKTDTYKRLEEAQYPMKALVQRAIAVKKQGSTLSKPSASQAAPSPVDYTPDTTPSYENEIEEESKRDNSNQTTEAALETAQREGTSVSAGKVGGSYDYWRPSTTEFPIHRQRGVDTPYWQTVNTPARARYQAIFEYLKNSGAFDRVNNNQVLKGDEVHFGISKELSEKVGKPIILLLNSNNEVIGDLPMPEDASFSSYAGLPLLYEGASKWYQDNHESLHAEGNDIAVIPGYKSNVARNMVGKPQYTALDDTHTLNQINTVTTSDGSTKQVPFRLGIAIANADSDRVRIMSDAGRSKSQGASPLERTIIAPLRASKGQPFLLMPTSSKTRAFVSVPIMMPRFDANSSSIMNSSLGKEIVAQVEKLRTIPNNTDQIMKWINGIQELLSIPEVHVNFTAPTLTIKGRAPQELVVTIKRPGETKQTTIYKGPQEQAVDAVLNGLSGSMFQVSRKYINDTYNGKSYNEMIGELATTNLPIGATHTINDWFTIDPIVDRKQQKAHSPKSTKVNPTQTQGTVTRLQDTAGNSYYLTSSNRLYKENPNGNDIELLGDRYNSLKAHAYGSRIGEPLTRPYDTPWGYYNPQTGKFQSKESSEKPIAIRRITDAEYKQIFESSSKIKFNASDHSYTIDGKPADMSVTQWVHRGQEIEPELEGILGYLEISGRLGTEIDTMARNFFDGIVYDSPLFTKEQNIAAREQIQKLKDDLDEKFGKGTWRAITDENTLRVAGTIKTPKGVKTIAGTMDMLIQDSKGNFHIIDFKTKRAKVAGQHGIIGDTAAKYDTLVSMYAKLLQESNPLLKGKITSSYLAVFNNFYDAPKGGRSNETGYVTYTEENGWIYALVGESDRLFLHEQPSFNPATYNRLQLVNWDRTLPEMTGVKSESKPAPQPQVSREEAMALLKSMGLLNKKERNVALDKLSDDRVIKVAGMSKLKARQTLEKFDVMVSTNADVNEVFDIVIGSKPLNSEVTELMNKDKSWTKESEIARMKKVLPLLSEEGRVRLRDGLIKIIGSKKPAYAWGQFQNGIITLSDIAARGTMYHESFHFVTLTLLSPKELDTLYRDAEKRYRLSDRLKLEEQLAEDFRKFMQSYEDEGFFKNIFKTLKHIIKSIVGKETITNKLFHDIRRGALASRTINQTRSSLNRLEVYTKEEQTILNNAPRDSQGRLLAPNGNPTNLNEHQWLQVRTKNFINWFGDWINNPKEASKVVDENGEPLVVYRWDNIDFTIFDKTKQGSKYKQFYGKGFYFTSSKYFANWFGQKHLANSYFINSRELEEVNWEQSYKNTYMQGDDNDYGDRHITNIHYNMPRLKGKTLDEFVISNPNQIKSAISNNGDFSTTNNDIRYSRVDSDIEETKYLLESAKQDVSRVKSDIFNRYRQFIHDKETKRWSGKFRQYSNMKYQTQSEAASAIPQLYKDFLDIIEDRGRYIIVYRKDTIDFIADKAKAKAVAEMKRLERKLLSLLDRANSNLLEDYQEPETYYREIEQYHREKLDYGRLSQEQKDYITERGLTINEYNSMTPQEKEVLFRCMY